MKNKIIFSLLAIVATSSVLFLNSCSKLQTLSLQKTYSNIDFTIPSPQPAGTFDLEEEVITDLQDLASSNGFDINKIESASINSITLTINDPNIPPFTFDVIDNAICLFEADGVAVAEVGTDDAVQTSPTQMNFDLKGVDVTPYLKANNFKVKMRITTNAAITHDVPMSADIKCTFKVKPLK